MKKQQEDKAERLHLLTSPAARRLRDLLAAVAALSARVQPGATVVRDKMASGVRPKCVHAFPAV